MNVKKQILELAENESSIRVEKQEYYIQHERMNTNDTLYERLENDPEAFELFEFPAKNWDLYQNLLGEDFNEEIEIGELMNIIGDFEIEGFEIETFEDETLSSRKKYTPELYNKIIEVLENLDFETVDNLDIDDFEKLFDCDYIDEIENTVTFEALAYWTTYFQPDHKDIQIAIKCGLTPFYYDGEFFLTLGGCGMDLSPKLDSYIALTNGYIPEGSTFFRDKKYFKYVTSEKIMKEIDEKCKREEPNYIISFEGD